MQLRNCSVNGHCSLLVLSVSTLEFKDFNQQSSFKIFRSKHLTPQFFENAEHQNSLVEYKRGTVNILFTTSSLLLSQTCSISFTEVSPTSRFNFKKKRHYFKRWIFYSAGEKKACINPTFQRHTSKNFLKIKPNLDGIRYREYHCQL